MLSSTEPSIPAVPRSTSCSRSLRDAAAAKCLFRKALTDPSHPQPHVINTGQARLFGSAHDCGLHWRTGRACLKRNVYTSMMRARILCARCAGEIFPFASCTSRNHHRNASSVALPSVAVRMTSKTTTRPPVRPNEPVRSCQRVGSNSQGRRDVERMPDETVWAAGDQRMVFSGHYSVREIGFPGSGTSRSTEKRPSLQLPHPSTGATGARVGPTKPFVTGSQRMSTIRSCPPGRAVGAHTG